MVRSKKIAVLHPQAHIQGGALKMMLYGAQALSGLENVEFISRTNDSRCFPVLKKGLSMRIISGPFWHIRLALYLKKFDVALVGNPPMQFVAILARLFGWKGNALWWHHHVPWYYRGPLHPAGLDRAGAFIRWKGFLEKFFAQRFIDSHICASQLVSDCLREYMGASSQVVYPVLDPAFEGAHFRMNDGSMSPLRIITHGRVVKGKGVEQLILLFLEMRDVFKDLEFWVIGDGNLLSELEDRFSTSGLRFWGDRSTQEIVELYGECDVSMFASTIDAFGMSIFESVSTGIPTIVLDAPGSREALGDAKNGYICTTMSDMKLCLEDVLQNISSNDNIFSSTHISVKNRTKLSSLGPVLLNLINKN